VKFLGHGSFYRFQSDGPRAYGARMKKLTAAFALTALTGCGFSSGFVHGADTAVRHELHVDVTTMRHVRRAEGSASTGSVLCMIPIDGGLYKRAMEKLQQDAHLEANELLENVREDHDFAVYLGFYCSHSLTVSADVVSINAPALPVARAAQASDGADASDKGEKTEKSEKRKRRKRDPGDDGDE
jgi:hypothetical protein